jgi:hypothetical protein
MLGGTDNIRQSPRRIAVTVHRILSNRFARPLVAPLLGGMLVVAAVATAAAEPSLWKLSWPKTNFSKHTVDFAEIISGGPPKDGIPSIDDPKFVTIGEAKDLPDTEPVISITVNGDARAYPLRVLIWHEIVNDTVGGMPVSVTYCPLCNSSIVFERRMDGRELDFGTTGKLRRSDLVMYDRQTESWWQQFTGTGIVGAMTGKTLRMLPSRVESFARFRASHPGGKVLVPTHAGLRPYGRNPYAGYDSARRPFLYRGSYPDGIAPMAYVVAVGKQAWSLDVIRKKKSVIKDDLRLTWAAGQNSALDSGAIAEGRDIGNVVVQRRSAKGWTDAVHDLTFAFVFHAFVPDGVIHK